MRVEKINDNQVKFILNHSDLNERDIKLTEIIMGTDKIQLLLRDMLQQATLECGFEPDNAPLMIEAMPIKSEGIMIIVTKVAAQNDIYGLNNILNERKKTKAKTLINFASKAEKDDAISIFAFDSLDDAAGACGMLTGIFYGRSALYKDDGRYIMIFEDYAPHRLLTGKQLDAILGEFGQKIISNPMHKSHIHEHCELMIGRRAVDALAVIR